jgi:uncharacterized protein (TIGR02147 family)
VNPPVVFDYRDYRSFLRDMFACRKGGERAFSYRIFASKAGFASPNFLKLVIEGQRNLTNGSIAKVAKGFGLGRKEREFFENLVFMNQSTTHEEKDHYYRKMMAGRSCARTRKLEKAQYDYFSKWYYPVIREIIAMGEELQAPEALAALLSPSITAREAAKALAAMEELGLIRKDGAGKWEQCDQALTTGPEVRSMAVFNFHREMIGLALESLGRHPSAERDITALTLSVSNSLLPELKKRIAAFRKELLDLACADEHSDRVFQMNFQLFPLTDRVTQEGEK